MNPIKTSKIEFKLDPDLFNSYKSLCEKNGLDMSKRLRLFIQYELLFEKMNKNIFKELDSRG